MNIREIEKILPQKPPFLFVDKVLEVEPGKKVVAIKNVTINEGFFADNFSCAPIFPQSLIIEAMAQTSILLYYTAYKDNLEKKSQYYLGSVKAQFFNQKVFIGDTLRIKASTVKLLSHQALVEVKTKVEEKKICEAEFIFGIKR